MKNYSYFLLVLISTISLNCMALTPRQVFISAPPEIIATVDSITRLDMIDYFEAGSTSASRNALGGESRITALDDNHLTVSTSSVSELDFYLLPASRDTAIVVISTLQLPAHDSSVRMYDSTWRPIKLGKLPDNFNRLEMWMLPEAKGQRLEIENIIPFIPVKIVVNDNTLTVSNSLSELLNTDDYARLKPLLRESVSYTWNGKKWTQVKQ